MKRSLSSTAIPIYLMLAVSLAVHASQDKSAAAVTKTDSAKGATLYSSGDSARNIPACVACHGDAGNSTIPQNPKLAAQHDLYIYKQLNNFKSPDRNNAVMSPIAKTLTDQEMKDIAGHMAAQTQKSGWARNKDTVEIGKRIYRAGIAEKNVPACAGCHGPNGAGIPAQFPRIGGQHQEYTAAQLTNFRAGVRKNSPQMITIAKRLSDDEIQAVSDYVAGLR
jgi:cytochrome c553